MRIVHVYKDAFPPVHGGIEQHIALLSELQSAAGHEVSVIAAGTSRVPARNTVDGVEITRLPEVARLASSPVTTWFARVLRSLDADVVHFHHPNPAGELAEPVVPRHVARVATYHADITRQRVLGPLYRPLLRRFLRRMQAVIVGSQPLLESSPLLSAVGDRARVVPFGVRPLPSGPSLPRQPRTLLFVGRLREYKGLSVLLRAIAQVDGVRLRVVGSGPLGDELRALAKELRVSDRVTFAGEVSDEELDREYRTARALVLPSTRRSEAFGLVLAEALGYGTPCISTELGTATSWVNVHGETGLVVPPGDVRALAAAIRRLLDDQDQWSRYSVAAVQRAGLFSPSKMFRGVQAVYEAVT